VNLHITCIVETDGEGNFTGISNLLDFETIFPGVPFATFEKGFETELIVGQSVIF
jgi:hypothetical protein